MTAQETPYVWLTRAQVQVLHAESLRLFGGAPGLRDVGLLEGALARPRLAYVPDASVFALAASLGHGLTKSHAFVDGNKRTGLLAVQTFLFLNGYRFAPDVVDTVTTMEGVAAGLVSEEAFAAWIEAASALR